MAMWNVRKDSGSEPEELAPAVDQCRKRGIDLAVAFYLGKPLAEVKEITEAFLDLALGAIVDQGELYLDKFGTFRLKKYQGTVPEPAQLGQAVAADERTFRAGVAKVEVRFTKSRAWHRRLRRQGRWHMLRP